MSSDNARKRKARAVQRQTGEPYMRARRIVDAGGGTVESQADADDAAVLLNLFGLPASVSPHDIKALWKARDLPARTGDRVHRDKLLTIPLGADSSGEPVWLDLKERAHGGEGPHAFIAGATGCGKTALLHAISLSLCVSHSPQLLELAIVDDGRGGFDAFARYPHAAIVSEHALSEAVDFRMEALLSARVRSLAEYHALRADTDGAHMPTIPYMVVVIDEAERLDDRNVLERLWRCGRSLGIHTVSATDAPTDFLSLSNVDSRIALKARTRAMSVHVIGNDAAFKLPWTCGAGLLRTPLAARSFHSYWVSPDTVRAVGGALAKARERP